MELYGDAIATCLFDKPTQVLFKHRDDDMVHAGIGFGNIIICGCCGGIIELIDNSLEYIKTLEWIDIEEAIGE